MRSSHQRPLRLSILDRLTDLEPGSSDEAPLSQGELARELKTGLCRDLTELLNTRRAERDFDPVYEQSTNSLLTYGVVDFTAYNLKTGLDREELRRAMERSIRQFEPRLMQVSVSAEEPDAVTPVLRFQISGVLRADPMGGDVTFSATVHRDSRHIAVSGGAR